MTEQTTHEKTRGPFAVLSLDGGGAKGFYTLGVLKEVEAMVGRRLCEVFGLIYGTSTGAIIASLLALGRSVSEIKTLYETHVPAVLGHTFPRGRSRALKTLALEVFKEAGFTEMKTPVGVVATHWRNERPLIFKSSISQAHGRRATFQPGFGVSVGEAVRASCSAYPFFRRTILKMPNGDVEAGDGGFCANNPTMYAIADAVAAFGRRPEDLRVLSVGVGVYPEPKRWGFGWIARRWPGVPLLQKVLSTNTLSMEQLTSVLYRQVPLVRINDTFERPEMATDLLEHDLAKLSVLFQQGCESFAKREPDIRRLLDPSANHQQSVAR
jgi:uncharacterized protein